MASGPNVRDLFDMSGRVAIVTGGGLVGKVVRVDDIYADVELAPGMKVKAVKATLTDVIDPMTAKPAND